MHVVSFVSGKGGVGKSTIAANVSYALATRIRVLGIDASSFDRTFTKMLTPGCSSAFGLYDWLFHFREVGGAPAIETCEAEKVNLEVLPPGDLEKAVRELSFSVIDKRLSRLLDALIRHFSLVVVDYPGGSVHLDPVLQALLRHTDHVVLVLTPSDAALSEARAMYQFITRRYDPPPVISVVLNMYAGEKIFEEGLRTAGGAHVRIPISGEIMALGRVPKLQYLYAKDREFLKAVDRLADAIISIRMQTRHVVRHFS